MTHDASHSYTYDAENRITKVDGGSTATYGYDADGRRASRMVAGVETDYIYDLSGHVVADYGGGSGITTWHAGYVYVNGQALAEYFGPTYFYVVDHLGSTRLLTNYNGPSVIECDDYYPFGEQVSCGGTSTTTHKFTGYERDAESNLDNAQARYNSSSLGRFMSPDPIGNFVADATNPQTWNMYAYVNNNPLIFTDPTGTEKDDEGDDTPHELPSDPTAGAPVGTPADLPLTSCTTISGCTVEVHADPPPGDILTSDDLSLGGGPASVNGSGGGAGGARPQAQLNLSQKGQVCQEKVQGAVNAALNTSTTFLGPQMGGHQDDPSDPGLINGAYNFIYFAPGVQFGAGGSNAVPGANCGRFSGSGLHIPVNGGGCNPSGDSNSPFGFNTQQNGSYFTAHMDSANPYDDLFGFFSHLINNVILRRPHGC